MDWSKAKTILIIALLVTNIIIGGTYLSGKLQERDALKAAAQNAVTYAESHGVLVNCELPWEERKLPVLFVSLERGKNGGSCEYKGMSVEADEDFIGMIHPEEQGDADGELISAADALIELMDELGENGQGLEIEEVCVVYWLDLSTGEDTAMDTAVPAWKFVCKSGAYYIEAFEE